MSGSSFGKIFRITTWGESHGPGIGVVIDGCPAGLTLSAEQIQKFLDRRRPGQSKYTTKRNEADSVEILSGVFEGKTTGTPISLLVRNQDQRSRDYGNIAELFRPTMATLQSCSGPDMQIIRLQKNTVSGTTAAAGARQAVRRSDAWPPELSLLFSLASSASLSAHIQNQSGHTQWMRTITVIPR